jgi:hypothetical protein
LMGRIAGSIAAINLTGSPETCATHDDDIP